MPVNTAALKTFAPAMRRQLVEAVARKLDLLLNTQTPDTLSTYAKQVAELREQEADNREQLLERVAYTWFNRLCALRYLDARGWHPFGCKVLMPAGEGETQPELLKLMRAGSLPTELKAHTNEARLHGLLDGQIPPAVAGADPQGEVYRELVLASCRSYHELLPELFEGLDDASELLLPDDLLSEGSIAGGFRSQIRDDDCEDVEIIGWLYQFYISEKKDQVIGKVVKSKDIPAATQLFTPNWIVKYMVQNTIGAQWLATYPNSHLRKQMEFYIEPAEQSVEVNAKLTEIIPKSLNPEELTLMDPACGSGHILVEAYDLFKAIYLERGYQPREIPNLIFEKNLFGLDIDKRAAQLSSFCLLMKGRADDRRLFDRDIRLNVMALQDSTYFDAAGLSEQLNLSDHGLKLNDLTELKSLFRHATTFGSLIKIPSGLAEKLPAMIQMSNIPNQELLPRKDLTCLSILARQCHSLLTQYDAVIANPPYIGNKFHIPILKDFLRDQYKDYDKDLFSAFIDRNLSFVKPNGRVGFMSPFVWMFIASYANLRKRVISRETIASLIQLEYSGFEGATVPICTFTLKEGHIFNEKGTYIRLSDFRGSGNQGPKTLEAIRNRECGWLFEASQDEFRKIPGDPLAYWISEKALALTTKSRKMAEVATARMGLATGQNDKYVRLWHEVNKQDIEFNCVSRVNSVKSGKRWFPYSKGGPFRKWFGNNTHIVDWLKDGEEMQTRKHSSGRIWAHNFNLDTIFRDSLTWSDITSGTLSVRWNESGFLFDGSGTSAFFDNESEKIIAIGILNSKFIQGFSKVLNPTFHFQTGDFRNTPYLDAHATDEWKEKVRSLISRAEADWNSFESSWGFQHLPLLSGPPDSRPSLKESYEAWTSENNTTVRDANRLEQEINRCFIDFYGLADELTPDVPIEQISLTVNPAYRYAGDISEEEKRERFQRDSMAELLSYVTGCMVGRYSLDHPGLILSDSRNNQDEQLAAYEAKVGKSIGEVQFKPDPDGIIPVLDSEWFEDDIVSRTREFIEVTFPESSVTENLRFIEESLGKDIRKYFCTEFYKDHLQTYKKRPIYWIVQSPKKGFACLIYLHRYTKDTLNQVLNNYFRPYLQKLEARLAQLEQDQINDDLKPRERTAARKEAEKITKVLKECQAWEQDALLPLAQQRIELDLDDGVKVNYLKLQDVLATIPGLAAKGE